MASVMYILGWKAEGLRCPDHEIRCCNDEDSPHPITLIQMPNGTGKTTTLSLLRAALSGSADGNAWSPQEIREFQKRDNPAPGGTFELRLFLNDQPVTIIMEFDFEVGRVYYKTTGKQGQREGFHPPMGFQRFMKEEFVKFYVFDGELADNILSSDHTEAQKAVESLFQIHLLKHMQVKISDYWKEQTSNVTTKDQRGLTRRKNRLDKWRARLSTLEKQKREFVDKLAEIEKNLSRQQERYKNEIEKEKNRADRIRDAEVAVTKNENRVQESAKGVLDTMRDPHAMSPVFATSMYDLKRGLDRVQLPESAAREFFVELADEDQCVCGRPIDAEIRDTIRERSNQYLGSDDVSLLNNIKSAVEDAVKSSGSEASDNLSQAIEVLREYTAGERKAKNDLEELKEAAESADPGVKRAKEEIDRLTTEQNRLKAELARFEGTDDTVHPERINSTDPDRIFSIKTVRQAVSNLEDQVSEATGTLNLKRKRDILQEVIDIVHGKARDYITSEITNDANKRIAELMPDNMVGIKEIDKCVVLKGQSSGSAGENLAIGYAFLATLFNRSGEHQLPFVVDSPANPIDYDIRPKIGQLIPDLADQFIAFVISSERERFLPGLQKAAKGEIRYITLFRRNIGRYTKTAKNSKGCIETADGMKVVDEEFFNSFQLDSEEEN